MTNRTLLKMMFAALLVAPAAGLAAPRDETVSTAADQHSVAVTIYSDNLALVKDARRVELARDLNELAWRDVSAQIRPETARLRNPSNPAGFRLREQRFDFDPLTPETLLEKYLGREVSVIRSHPTTGVDARETATVLATRGGVVLRFADRIETGVPGRLAYPAVPDTLRAQPTLVASLVSAAAGTQALELSYLTGGLSWRADYVAELNSREDQLDLSGWVTLTNESGAAYPHAKLQLVAGNLNRVRDERPPLREAMAMSAKVADAGEMQPQSLFEYHLYTLPQPTTLADKQTKQVALMAAPRVPVNKTFVLEGANYYYSGPHGELPQQSRVGVMLTFANRGDGLALPLPRGVVRVYQQDREGNAQFVGEDRIEHTPRNETVRLKLGDAFDLTADKKQTAFQKIGSSRDDTVFESAYEIVLKNAKPEAATVTVREPIPGDWTMVSESQPHAKTAANMAEWRVQVPAGGTATLRYRVRVRF